MKAWFIVPVFLILLTSTAEILITDSDNGRIISYIVDPVTQEVRMFWKNDSNVIFKNAGTLNKSIESKKQTLVFAMNGGMYRPDHSPQGLYVENGKTLKSIDTASGNGNFYMKPNGVFYITKEKTAAIRETSAFKLNSLVQYVTQSGPMLVINGNIHSAFKQGSANLNIRNGVGILPDGKILFAMSKEEINFYNFALFFKEKGCREALYLDGFVSRMYLPEKNWIQTDGEFGVMIGVVK
jgi:uncharacterized protein YigE (DUF2233 family)